MSHEKFMLRAIELAQQGMDSNTGGPFGCVIVKNNERLILTVEISTHYYQP
mgnify:CR=1 FL=1